MRVTNQMLLNRALTDLDGLRERYAKAQDSINGRVLSRPSEDPRRVVEAIDLAGTKMRMEQAQRAGEDARDWLLTTESRLTNMIEQLQSARELAVQAGSVSSQGAEEREALALAVDQIKQAMLNEMNATHLNQYIFGGTDTTTQPFELTEAGGAQYVSPGDKGMTRAIAPGLTVEINVAGSRLTEKQDFILTLSQMAADLRAGRTDDVTSARLDEISTALSELSNLRSDLGARQNQVLQYEDFTQEAMLRLEDRLSKISGADLETAVLQMVEAQTAYNTALASFSKSLPTSLIDYMLR